MHGRNFIPRPPRRRKRLERRIARRNPAPSDHVLMLLANAELTELLAQRLDVLEHYLGLPKPSSAEVQ